MVVEPAYLLPILPDDDPIGKEKTHTPRKSVFGLAQPMLLFEKGTLLL